MIRDVNVVKSKIGMSFAHLLKREQSMLEETSGIETEGTQTGEERES
jgi:hypothetical protein